MSKLKILPLGNRVVVERKEVGMTKGGILLPDSAKEKPQRGRVIAVGPGTCDDKGEIHPMDLKIGDEVIFSSYSGNEYRVDHTEYLLLTEDDILATIN